jgi:hypothetical protein
MFDIEFYLVKNDEMVWWKSELHSLPIVKGLVKFILEKKDKIDIDEFIKDATEIQELRGWLYEKHDNRLKPLEVARQRHYVFLGEFDEIIKKFVNKYGLDLNID